ncbi:MAG TPA: class I SAM-dependent methyltransferase [Gaiellaceae bacterium]|nr:class I SAM-dependent methyltransferase [Gaiellaceae bacterium]
MRLAAALEPIYHRAPTPFVAMIARRLGLPVAETVGHFREGRRSGVTTHLLGLNAPAAASGHIGLVPGALLYAIVRTLRPTVMVETGVASGMSSAFVLAAMRDNQHGTLVSIDLPFTVQDDEPAAIVPGTSIEKIMWSPIPPGTEHGWLVPPELRDRWDLRLGDARELLPAAVEELGSIDIFLHDSLHTLEHMLFEFETAWPHIAPGGLLATDDLGRKGVDPLQRFSHHVGLPFHPVGAVGFIRKPGAV